MWWLATTALARGHRHRALQLGADGQHRAARRARAGASGSGRVAPRPAQRAGRRAGRRTRTTESSQRMWMGRSWASSPSTSGPRRATASSSSWAMGSSLRLPLVMTSGPVQAASSRWCSGVYGSRTPELGQARGDAGGHAGARPPRREHDGAARRRRAAAVGRVVELARALGRGQVGDHDGEGLVVPVPCGGAARRPPSALGGVDGQVVAAEALDRDDRRRREHDGRGGRASSPSATDAPVGGRQRSARARRRGRRWAGRGSGGRPDPRTRAGTPRTSRTPAIVVAGRS